MTQKIAVIDYGMGNLKSVSKAFETCGANVTITNSAQDLKACDKIVLPGVGAFSHCMSNLKATGLVDTLKELLLWKKPFLGICLGMQLLFDSSEEGGNHEGLGIIPGRVVKFSLENNSELKIPHMGWNGIKKENAASLFTNIPDSGEFYFVHSYHCIPDDPYIVSSTTHYNQDFCSSIELDTIFACQFHPEKSQKLGLQLIKNFISI